MPPDLFPPPPGHPTSTWDIGASRHGAKLSPKKLSTLSRGNVPSHTFPLDSQKSPKNPRTLPASPRKTNQGVYTVNSVKATEVEQVEFHFSGLLTMPPELNDEGPLAVTNRYVMLYQLNVSYSLIISFLS